MDRVVLPGCAMAPQPGSRSHAEIEADEGRDVRQVGMVDAAGVAAAFTGESCVEAAGHGIGHGFSVQANMMERSTVWPAMAQAFQGSTGPLADRLIAALLAAEAEGGDVRGRQSAALLVVPGQGPAWATRYDLRVEDHRAPLDELARLLRLARAYEAFDRSEEPARAGDLATAAAAMEEAHALAPDDDQITLWTSMMLAGTGRLAEARALFREARRVEPRSAEHLRRFLAAGHLPPAAGAAIDVLEADDDRGSSVSSTG